jgi:hypothetical protein
MLIAGSTCSMLSSAGGPEFPASVQVIGQQDILAPAGFSGRQLLELRLAPGPREGNGDASSILHVAALVAGTPGTTLLTARLGAVTRTDINALPADLIGQIDSISAVAGLVNAQAFSLGGGCAGNASGSDTIFPIVRGLRWHNVRMNASGSSVEGPFGPTTVHSIDCATTPDRSAIYYFLVNGAAPVRGELWRQDSTGVALVSAGFAGLNSPFSGGVRPALVYGPAPQQLTLQYLLTSGSFINQVIHSTTLNVLQACTSGSVSPPPTTFTTVWEGRLMRGYWAAATGVPARFAAGDFNRNGIAEGISHGANGCALTTVPKASAGGGNGYNWTGYSASADPTRPIGGLLGAGRLLQTNLETGQVEEVPNVTLGTGGPIDSVPFREAASRRTGIFYAQPGLSGQAAVLMRVGAVVYQPDGSAQQIYEDSFERVGVGAILGGNQ